MINILVTGSEGQLGSEIKYLSGQFAEFHFIYIDVNDLDITDAVAVSAFFKKHQIDYCINCAAYTAVDKAEGDYKKAHLVNAIGVKNMAEGCYAQGAKLIQISTDYVYHSQQNVPFKENDPVNPQSVYGSTKLEGDRISLAAGGMVIRTSWVYSSYGNNFVKTMIRLGTSRDQIGVIFDQIGTPTYARDLAMAILLIIQKLEKGEVGEEHFNQIYHFSNEGVTSWYDFAMAIFEAKNLDVKVNAIETVDYPTPAKRPHFSLLNKGKIKKIFGVPVPHWKKSLEECLKLI